jgi:hypothetical protein
LLNKFLEDITLSDFTDTHYSQSMVAFQLPDDVVVNNYSLDKSVNLDTQGNYSSFGLNVNLLLDKDKTVLFIYNVNLKVEGSVFTVRLRMGNKFNRKSVMSMKDIMYGRASGYVLRVLKKGSYNFDLDFKSDSKNSYNPETADSQNVSLQIIEFD